MEELARWGKGVLVLEKRAKAADLRALRDTFGDRLPEQYLALLSQHDGADFRGDRLFSAAEALAHWSDLRTLMTPSYRLDPDWPHDTPPADMLPFATDQEGNLKVLDLGAPAPDVLDWHRESGQLVTWHREVSGWLMTSLRKLSLRFDYKGRPRVMTGVDSEALRLEELQVHLEGSPARPTRCWRSRCGTPRTAPPEVALFAFREAAQGTPERAMNHFLHARWAILWGRHAEARAALRRCVAIPSCARNPRRDSFRTGYRPAAHALLLELYLLADQSRKAEEQKRELRRMSKKYGFDWYEETEEYQEVSREILRGTTLRGTVS